MKSNSSKMSRQMVAWKRAKLLPCLIFLLFLPIVFFSNCSKNNEPEKISASDTSDTVTNPNDLILAKNHGDNPAQYAVFSHSVKEHLNLDCAECHKREDNSINPKYAGHASCINCHFEQFVTENSPMCAVCHSDVKDAPAPVRDFPVNFDESFNMKFDHAAHLKPGARPVEGCATCHKPLRGGVALSIPAGIDSHSTCYTCHTPDLVVEGQNLGNCNTCHSIANYQRTPTTSATFNTSFSHAKHQQLDCTNCHTVRANTPQRQQVVSPVVGMHTYSGGEMSCMSCHNDKITFGDRDFANCQRCHLGQNFMQVPQR